VPRLNALATDLAVRLPTDAEWEFACRAGTSTATWAGDLSLDGDRASVLDPICHYRGNIVPGSQDGPRPVREKLPNPLGLYDMLGNVREWCEDLYASYTTAAAIDPGGPEASSMDPPMRVQRGNAWNGSARNARAAFRSAEAPGGEGGPRERWWYRRCDSGLRLAVREGA